MVDSFLGKVADERRVTGRSSRNENWLALRWGFLEHLSDACCLVTRCMEVTYLNAAARSLVPGEWSGKRCWELFPVGGECCVAGCPAVKAVSRAGQIVYCEETIRGPEGSPVLVGIAVIPVRKAGGDEEKAILLLRPKPRGKVEEAFQLDLLHRARRLQTRCDGFDR